MKQLLNHRNPYTGRCLKDEPNILFVELINEPTQFPEDIQVWCVISTGCARQSGVLVVRS